ncbi:rhodanese-like domain-containing protein [Amycolatopsis sp. NPDC051061]|uniref:rhodanese-like domain-containing protein n=1 Tax=Amycolatopsis sp. NPDC051061 TaxID=3155042 RepID=UPI00342096F2
MTTARTLTVPAPAPEVAMNYFGAELAFEVDPDDLVRDLEAGHTDGYVVVETRAEEAFKAARIPGAINLPYKDMTAETTARLDKRLVYICYCESINCNAATKGALKLAELGFQVKRLSGGITSWIAAGYPVDGPGRTAAIRCAC